MTEEEFTECRTVPALPRLLGPRPARGRFVLTGAASTDRGLPAVRHGLCAAPYHGCDPPARPSASLDARPR
ncbi:hypothetical protein [Streptomyces sp. NPDC001415]